MPKKAKEGIVKKKKTFCVFGKFLSFSTQKRLHSAVQVC